MSLFLALLLMAEPVVCIHPPVEVFPILRQETYLPSVRFFPPLEEGCHCTNDGCVCAEVSDAE